MDRKTTYGLILLTGIALLIAPQVVRSDLIITRALPLVLYLIPVVWITVLIKNISNPDKN